MRESDVSLPQLQIGVKKKSNILNIFEFFIIALHRVFFLFWPSKEKKVVVDVLLRIITRKQQSNLGQNPLY